MTQPPERLDLSGRMRRLVFGAPRDVNDRRIFHSMALVPVLAWIGVGADGLSSSAYGPEEAFRALGEHRYLAVFLAVAMATTVLVIAAAYSRIIEHFPQGGGGYVVATALLGSRAGVVSACALWVDYVLTITISISAAGAALFSFLPASWHEWKVATDLVFIVVLMVLNIRGLRESVLVLAPIFVVFAVTHLVAILGGILAHSSDLATVTQSVRSNFAAQWPVLGLGGMLLLFLHAYSLGGGTYTGIEAVSNSLNILREPRVSNGKRTMLYMAVSLAFTASGLLLLYLLWGIEPEEGKTMNAVLLRKMTERLPGGVVLSFITILSEGALLLVAGQAGFIGGPRVLANMAVDSWVPRRFAALSERLTAHQGVVLMGVASIAALLYTQGNVRLLVILYSINVFITFTLSMFGMVRHSLKRTGRRHRRRDLAIFSVGLIMCGTILVITTVEKFYDGGWMTLLTTGALVLICFWIRRHYAELTAKLDLLYADIRNIHKYATKTAGEVDPLKPTAALLVGGHGGLGIHTLLAILRTFPNLYSNFVFVSVGVLDSGEFKGESCVESLKLRAQQALDRYVELARGLGMPATSRLGIGTDVVDAAEKICLATADEFSRITFFAGKVIFQRETWYHRLLHNETAFAIQKRLHWAGHVLVVLPTRVY